MAKAQETTELIPITHDIARAAQAELLRSTKAARTDLERRAAVAATATDNGRCHETLTTAAQRFMFRLGYAPAAC